MLRSTILVTGVTLSVSAAGALAFAPEFSRAGRAWSGRALRLERGMTPVSATGDSLHAVGDLARQSDDSAAGTYCPIPPRDSGTTLSVTGRRASAALDSSAGLVLQGQSLSALSAPAAMCTGTTPAVPPIP